MKIEAAKDSDLPKILTLQKRNLAESLTPEEMITDGFVTVMHDLKILKAMNTLHAHSIAKYDNSVVGYALVMHQSFAKDIPILFPMFKRIDNRLEEINPDIPLNYIVMGQICIEKDFRGQGIFAELYSNLRMRLSNTYDQIITEVDMRNKRSLNAHTRVGFETLEKYNQNNIEWNLLSWKW